MKTCVPKAEPSKESGEPEARALKPPEGAA